MLSFAPQRGAKTQQVNKQTFFEGIEDIRDNEEVARNARLRAPLGREHCFWLGSVPGAGAKCAPTPGYGLSAPPAHTISPRGRLSKMSKPQSPQSGQRLASQVFRLEIDM